ncbi:hypothetical protein N9137_00725 [Pseudomonadales bacterium]|nr:hypothetical protein [Pseudomonadales bacterium]
MNTLQEQIAELKRVTGMDFSQLIHDEMVFISSDKQIVCIFHEGLKGKVSFDTNRDTISINESIVFHRTIDAAWEAFKASIGKVVKDILMYWKPLIDDKDEDLSEIYW